MVALRICARAGHVVAFAAIRTHYDWVAEIGVQLLEDNLLRSILLLEPWIGRIEYFEYQRN